jgi:hypothetical protein
MHFLRGHYARVMHKDPIFSSDAFRAFGLNLVGTGTKLLETTLKEAESDSQISEAYLHVQVTIDPFHISLGQ